MAVLKQKEVLKISIKYKDIFHLKELYKLVHFWFRDNDWVDPVYKMGENFETLYLQKDFASGLKEHIIRWNVEKIPHQSAYFKFKIELEFLTLLIKDVEIMHEGKKLPANSGEIKMTFKGTLVYDYKRQWDKSSFLKHFHNLWQKRIYKKEMTQYEDDLRAEVEKLQGAVKKYLDLKGFLMEFDQEPFHISRSHAW